MRGILRPHSILWPLSIPYGVVVGVRNRLYDLGILPATSVSVPVISVGNISVGGTGKTPFTLELIDMIAGINPRIASRIAVVSRGYGRSGKGLQVVADGTRIFGDPFTSGDEPYMIAEKSRRTIVIVDNDRVRGANHAVDKLNAKVIILDDGFQHRRLARDINIILLDGLNPLGNRLLLPAGLLRESVSALSRADIIVLSKSVGDPEELDERSSKLSELTGKPVAATILEPQHWSRIGKAELEGLEQILGKRVAAFAGIAQPRSFFELIEDLGAELVAAIPLPDHSNYGKAAVELICRSFSRNRAEWLVTTEKDAVKLPPILRLLPAYSLVTRHRIVTGEGIMREIVSKAITST